MHPARPKFDNRKLTSDTLNRWITRSRANPAYNPVPHLEKAEKKSAPGFLNGLIRSFSRHKG